MQIDSEAETFKTPTFRRWLSLVQDEKPTTLSEDLDGSCNGMINGARCEDLKGKEGETAFLHLPELLLQPLAYYWSVSETVANTTTALGFRNGRSGGSHLAR